MIKKLKIGLMAVALLSLVFVGARNANAQAVSLGADVTITIGSANYTASSGGAATAFTVATSTLTVTVPASSTFTLVSADRYKLNNDQSVSQQCSASQNSITLTGPLTDVIITPDTTITCAYSNPSTSSGSSSGSYVSSADTTPPTNTAISINAGAASTTSTNVTLTLTATGASDVMVSNVASFYNGVWAPYVSSMPWTVPAGDGIKTVYAKFRDTAGNISAAVQDTIGIGVSAPSDATTPATPATPAVPGNEIPGCGNRTTGFSTSSGLSCVGNTPTTPATPATPATPGASASTGASGVVTYALGTVTLRNGSRGEAVKELQRVLNKLLNLGLVVDGKLGKKTIAVIKKWQKDHKLVVDGLVGKKTKAAMVAEVALMP